MKFFEPIFDNTMNLELAINYLKHNKTIHPIEWEGDGTFNVNEYKIQIFYSKYEKNKVPKKEFKDKTGFLKLADLIEKDGDLICQLEYLLRDIPMEDVKKFDLELIKQIFTYYSMYRDGETAFDGLIVMSDKSPLASLGCIVYADQPVTVIASQKSAIICSLFVNLCKQAGLQDMVNLCIVNNISDVLKESISPAQEPICLENIEEINSGCVGVVTAKADIDSAVGAFLFASDQNQWRVKKIFVQESVVDHFLNALEWHSAAKPNIDTELQKASTKVFQYETKLFLYGFVGDLRKITNATLIEAYRTVKELKTLIKQKKSICVSVWSSDVAESNEIAHSVASNIVWINGYGHIDNPHTANAFYSIIHRHHNRLYNDFLLKSLNIESFTKAMSAWIKLDKRARFEIVRDWLRKLKSDNLIKVFNNRLVIDDSDSSVSVGQQMCISMKKPVDFIFMKLEDLRLKLLPNERLLKFLVDGGCIIFIDSLSEIDKKEKLTQNTHIACVEKSIFIKSASVKFDYNYEKYLLYTNKVIWSSIGTVFAN